MKEHGMIFSGPMVRALLNGKTQTRRPIKLSDPTQTYACFDDDGWPMTCDHYGDWSRDRCPFGTVGDHIWVRETFAYVVANGKRTGNILYRADSIDKNGHYWGDCSGCIWTPSIHMPRWASRITLEITEIRVQRLQEISEEDAACEGLERTGGDRYWLGFDRHHVKGTLKVYGLASRAFQSLWESCYGPGAWDANPWCWAISFSRIQPQDAAKKGKEANETNPQ